VLARDLDVLMASVEPLGLAGVGIAEG